MAVCGLILGLLLNTVLTVYGLLHPEVFYDGDPAHMNGAIAYLAALVSAYAQVGSTPVVIFLLVRGALRVQHPGSHWHAVLGGICTAFLLCCAVWWPFRPTDRTGPDLGWVYDNRAPGWVRLIALGSPLLVVAGAAAGVMLLGLIARARRRAHPGPGSPPHL